jgi:hypothetical protein
MAAVEPDEEDKADETGKTDEPKSGDDGQTEDVADDTMGATSDNPFTEFSLGESNKKAKAAGLKTFWWVNNYPGSFNGTSGHKATW